MRWKGHPPGGRELDTLDTHRGRAARTAQADIARRAGLKPRMVRYALASLEAKGMVHVVRRGRLNAGPSIYRVHPIGAA
jgi:DNA-binding IclR family transcriptional regulator